MVYCACELEGKVWYVCGKEVLRKFKKEKYFGKNCAYDRSQGVGGRGNKGLQS